VDDMPGTSRNSRQGSLSKYTAGQSIRVRVKHVAIDQQPGQTSFRRLSDVSFVHADVVREVAVGERFTGTPSNLHPMGHLLFVNIGYHKDASLHSSKVPGDSDDSRKQYLSQLLESGEPFDVVVVSTDLDNARIELAIPGCEPRVVEVGQTVEAMVVRKEANFAILQIDRVQRTAFLDKRLVSLLAFDQLQVGDTISVTRIADGEKGIRVSALTPGQVKSLASLAEGKTLGGTLARANDKGYAIRVEVGQGVDQVVVEGWLPMHAARTVHHLKTARVGASVNVVFASYDPEIGNLRLTV